MNISTSLRRRQAFRLTVLKVVAVAFLCIFAAVIGAAAFDGAANNDTGAAIAMVPFIGLGGLMFRSPESGGGGGGGESEFPKTLPEPTGETHEAKLLSATGIIANLFKLGAKAVSDLGAKIQAYSELDGTAKQSNLDLKAEQDAHVATKGLLETEKTAHGTTSGKLVKSEERVKHLESLCNLKGIDPNQVVPPAPASQSSDDERADLVKQLNAAKTPEARGELANKLRDFDAKAKRTAAKAKE